MIQNRLAAMSINNLYKEVLVFLGIEKTTLQKRQKRNTSFFGLYKGAD
jgi:hypothetical protein